MSVATITEQFSLESVAPLKLTERETVSVVIPCYNEEQFIEQALANLVEQYPVDRYEIIVVDGMSEDGTRDLVKKFQHRHPAVSIQLIDNPARNIPTALNLGIAAARGEIIARMDAHAVPSPNYIRRCVDVLQKKQAAVVGMPCRIQASADGAMAQAIASAVSHPFGIGDAKYRLKQSDEDQKEVDTVAFACFRKSLWVSLKGFDESLLTNEDYDFNYRVRARGEKVILDSAAHCDYFARPTLVKLSAQYRRYGFWKARMVRQQPRSIKLRHLVAPIFVASLVLLIAIGFWQQIALKLLALELAVYFVSSFIFAIRCARKNKASFLTALMMPLAFFTIHFSWGTSFLVGLIKSR